MNKKKKDNNVKYEEEELEELEEENNILPINKVTSIDIKSNSIPTHYYSTTNPKFYSISNNSNSNSNSNSNKSFTKKKCYTESDDSFTRSFLFDPPSERSNNSGNSNFSYNIDKNHPSKSRFKFANTLINNLNNNINRNIALIQDKKRALMGSFLSTGENSYSYSGQRFDTSNSNESGQSPHNFNVKERQLSNNNINNNINFYNIKNNIFNAVNNNYMMKMNTHINTLDRYSSTFNSNEFFF